MMDFEVRLIDGAVAVIGEEVTFKEDNGKLLAPNEDGDQFGVVPNRYAEQLRELEKDNPGIVATVVSRGEGVSTVRIDGASPIADENVSQPFTTVEHVGSMNTPLEVNSAMTSCYGEEPNKQSSTKLENEDSSKETQPKKRGHRVAIVVIVVLIIVALYAFAVPHKSSDVSDAMYTVGTEALEVVDDYYDGYLTSYEAYKELIDLQDRADEIKDRSDYSDDVNVYFYITCLKVEFFSDAGDEKITEYVDRLENTLYLY